MLALAPLDQDAAPLDQGERFALDLLIDLSGVLRMDVAPTPEVVRLRITGAREGTTREVRTLFDDDLFVVRDGEVALPRWTLALVRDVAGGVAEQRSGARDRHGRVPSSENVLVQDGSSLERVPVVSRAAGSLAAAVARAAGRRPAFAIAPWPGGRRWAAALTHDLDVVDWWPAFTALRLAELAGKRELRQALSVTVAALSSVARDVVGDGVRGVLDAESAFDVRSSWFILCGDPTLASARAGDLTYRPDGTRARRILRELVDAGHEIGLHGSFATSEKPALFATQRARLASLTATPVDGVRQHYLRTRPSTTPAAMSASGFRFDSTCGFADRNGFRLGVADVLPTWDASNDVALPIDEAPFCWMDRALSKYRGVERPDAWIDDALALADSCRSVDGLFAGIWHPNLTPALGFPGAPAAYARLVAELVSRDAYVAPLGELVTWRRARRAVRAMGITADGQVALSGDTSGLRIERLAGGA